MPDPKYSAGARLERAAFRSYLRRKVSMHGTTSAVGQALDAALQWVLKRQARYDRKRGGLGT